jgi:alpha 1,2-mannosyltransferase
MIPKWRWIGAGVATLVSHPLSVELVHQRKG